MKRIALPVLFAALLFVALSSIASACTVTTNCNNGCEIDIFCPRPYPHCELYCNAPSQTLSCSGSVCSGNSTSVTSDGVTTSCSTTSQYKSGSPWAQCGSWSTQCTYNCAL